MALTIKKIVSGGQTGADRAALDFALTHGIPCGGWVPKGRKAEDGCIPKRYPMTEAPSSDYLRRTELNVQDADANVIFTMRSTLNGGSKRTAEFAAKHRKPCLHLSSSTRSPADALARFIEKHNVHTVNIAGSRGSKEPTVGQFVIEVLTQVFEKTHHAKEKETAQK
jgi:hypothetical protein